MRQQVDQRRAGHAHHMRNRHQRQRQRGQKSFFQLLQKGRIGSNIRQARKPAHFHRYEHDQDIGDKEFGRGNRGQGKYVHSAVIEGISIQRRQYAQNQRQRNRDTGGKGGEEYGIGKARAYDFANLATIADRGAPVSLQDIPEPVQISNMRWNVQP